MFLYFMQNKIDKYAVGPRVSEDNFVPSFDSALTDQEVCFPFRF